MIPCLSRFVPPRESLRGARASCQPPLTARREWRHARPAGTAGPAQVVDRPPILHKSLGPPKQTVETPPSTAERFLLRCSQQWTPPRVASAGQVRTVLPAESPL